MKVRTEMIFIPETEEEYRLLHKKDSTSYLTMLDELSMYQHVLGKLIFGFCQTWFGRDVTIRMIQKHDFEEEINSQSWEEWMR